MSTPKQNVPFYTQTWFTKFVAFVIVAWTMLKLAIVFVVNNFGGITIDDNYAIVFVLGLLPLYAVVYLSRKVERKTWKWLYWIDIVLVSMAVFVKAIYDTIYVILYDPTPHAIAAMIIDTTVESTLTAMMLVIGIAFAFTYGWQIFKILWALVFGGVAILSGIIFDVSIVLSALSKAKAAENLTVAIFTPLYAYFHQDDEEESGDSEAG